MPAVFMPVNCLDAPGMLSSNQGSLQWEAEREGERDRQHYAYDRQMDRQIDSRNMSMCSMNE